MKIGSPLLELARVLYDGNERPLSFQTTLVPPERRKLRLVIHADENGLTGARVLAAEVG